MSSLLFTILVVISCLSHHEESPYKRPCSFFKHTTPRIDVRRSVCLPSSFIRGELKSTLKKCFLFVCLFIFFIFSVSPYDLTKAI